MPTRTAVVVVHGMGQQQPGRLQRSLGRALATDEDTVYSAPDRISGRRDTHRVTIVHPDGDETHVYEHYWADRYQDTRMRHVLPWLARLLGHRGLGPRIGPRNGTLEWTVGIVASLPYLLLITAVALGNRSAVADLLTDVPTLGLLAALVLTAFAVTKLVVRSHAGAALVGLVAGAIGALFLDPALGSFEFATAALALAWAPGWLLVASGLKGVGPIAVLRMLLGVGILVPLSFSLVEGGLAAGGLPAAITLVVAGFWLRHWIGDVARYLDRSAANAEETDRLRRDAAAFLAAVCDDTRYGYDEVVVVAHSQGGFVAYDALTTVWERWAADHDIDYEERVAIDDIDRLAGQAPPSAVEWGAAVDELRDALRARNDPWKVSHFVTLGSPIGHAAGLWATGPDDLARLVEDRTLSTCPPRLHGDPGSVAYRGRHGRRFHHTSVFAAVRWSNVVYANDLLGGPVEDDGLGGAVRNLVLGDGDPRLSPTVMDFALRFPHDAYWRSPRPVFDDLVETSLELLRHVCRGD